MQGRTGSKLETEAKQAGVQGWVKPAGSEGTKCRGPRIRAPSGSCPSSWLTRPIACVRHVREPSPQALANVCMGVLSRQAGCSLSHFSRAVCSSRWPLSTMPSLELFGKQTRERSVWDLYTTAPNRWRDDAHGSGRLSCSPVPLPCPTCLLSGRARKNFKSPLTVFSCHLIV